MNVNTLLAGTLGGLVNFMLGFVFYVLIFGNYLAAHHGEGNAKDPPAMWALIAGSIAYGFLLTLIFKKWANITSLRTGAMAGLQIGILVGLFYALWRFGDSNYYTSVATMLLDTLGVILLSTTTGAVVALLLGREK